MVMTLAALMLAGCATPINWQARVGVYTYEQAVMDYGQPMTLTRFSDGSMVAEWMIEHGAQVLTPVSDYYQPGPWGPFWGPAWAGYSTAYFPPRFLRLQFGPDGRLKAWKEASK